VKSNNVISAGQMTISVDEMGQRLGVSRKTAWDLVKTSDFPSIRVGTRVLIPVNGLEKWINDKQHENQANKQGKGNSKK
jgi:excisionase family DNA binding protein